VKSAAWRITVTDRLNILYQFDNNYAPYAGISMLSLFENNKEIEELNVYCAAMEVEGRHIALLNEMASEYSRSITYLDVEHAMKEMQRIHVREWNGSLATWLKIFVVGGLIGKMDRILYIDSDTLVEGSLDGLCGFDFGGMAVACTVDSIGFEHLRRLQIKGSRYYYNAGVIFFNLLYFEENRQGYEGMLRHLRKNVGRYLVNEQDLLNDYFRKNIKKIGPEYNFQGIHCMYSDRVYFKVYGKYDYYSKEEIAKARENVRILHFFRMLGDYPWVEGNYHPAKEEFERWKELSLWKGEPAVKKKRSIIFKIERLLYRCLPKAVFLKMFRFITNKMDRARRLEA